VPEPKLCHRARAQFAPLIRPTNRAFQPQKGAPALVIFCYVFPKTGNLRPEEGSPRGRLLQVAGRCQRKSRLPNFAHFARATPETGKLCACVLRSAYHSTLVGHTGSYHSLDLSLERSLPSEYCDQLFLWFAMTRLLYYDEKYHAGVAKMQIVCIFQSSPIPSQFGRDPRRGLTSFKL
jgi:hypothetical protein